MSNTAVQRKTGLKSGHQVWLDLGEQQGQCQGLTQWPQLEEYPNSTGAQFQASHMVLRPASIWALTDLLKSLMQEEDSVYV